MVRKRQRIAAKLMVWLVCALALPAGMVRAQESQPSASQGAATRALGTVKGISGKNVTLATDQGGELNVQLQDGARLLRVEPGEKDLKNAVALELQDVQPGDRVLVRGKIADDGKTFQAASLIAMKKMDIAQRQAHEREEWQKHGVGGLVSAVDPASGAITLTTTALGSSKTVLVHVSPNTQLRRYAPGSVKFDEAKAAPIGEIKAGDQLRARGQRSADGSELTADEVVSGSFRNISGTISTIDTAAATVTVSDLATKKAVVVKITSDSQLRKLPAPMAQRIAARLKGTQGDAAPASAGQRPGQAVAPEQGRRPGDAEKSDAGRQAQGPADLQQAISRMPAAMLNELNKGDAVMIVATSGSQNDAVTAVTLLAGVELILEASPKGGQSILTPWSLSSPGGEAAAP